MSLTQAQKEEAIATLSRMIALLGIPAEVTDASTPEATILSVKTEKPGRLIGRKGQYLESLELVLNRIMKKSGDDLAPVTIDIDGYQRRAEGGGDGGERGEGGERRGRPGRGERRERGGERGGERRDFRERRGPREGRGREGGAAPGGAVPGGAGVPVPAPAAAPADAGEERSALPPELERLAIDAAKEVRLWGEPKTIGPYNARTRRALHDVLRDVPGVTAESGPDEGSNTKTIVIRPAAPGGAPAAGQGEAAHE